MARVELCVALLAVLIATAWAVHPDAADAPLTQAEALALAADASLDLEGGALGAEAWEGLGSGKNCSLYCNGEEVVPEEDALALGGNKTQVYSCWGTFKAFCRGKARNETVRFAGGLKCEGHWLYIKPVCDARIAVCAGSIKRFRAVGFEKCGRRLRVIKAGGCLGKSAVALAPPSNSSRRGAGGELAWPAEMPQMWAGDYEGPHAALVATLLGGGDAKTLAKATCEGLGGGVTVIKKAGCGAGGAGGGWPEGVGEAGYAALEGSVDQELAEAGMAVPPEPSLLPSFGLAALLSGERQCAVTCNGRRAYFAGKAPCMGRLEVDCDVDTPKGELEFSGACKGFWSGIFGGRCVGFTSAHTEFKDFDSYKFCAGRHGIFAKKGRRGFAFGAGCKGKALAALQVSKDEDDDDDK